jgi:hypothetical protein
VRAVAGRPQAWSTAGRSQILLTRAAAQITQPPLSRLKQPSGLVGEAELPDGSPRLSLTPRGALANGIVVAHAREHPESDYYSEVLAAEFRAHADSSDPDDIGSWVLHTLAEPSQTIAMFASGLGDGWYGSYWSLGADGEPVALAANFALAERL